MTRMSINGVPRVRGRRGKTKRRRSDRPGGPQTATGGWSQRQLNELAFALVRSGRRGLHVLDTDHASYFVRNGHAGPYMVDGWPKGSRFELDGSRERYERKQARRGR